MITVTRGTLLDSKAAIEALGKVYMPVGKEQYWFVKTLSKLQQALKREGKVAGKESNELVKKLGTVQEAGPNKGKPAIMQTDVDTMEQYTEAMDAFMGVSVQVDVKQITLSQLQAAQVTLQANDQVALMWLFLDE